MKKTAVVYWSGTGNTEAMAKAVAEGMESAGAQVTMLTPDQVKASELSAYDAIAFGCPAMGSEVLEEMEFQPMFDEVKRSLGGKSAAHPLAIAPAVGAEQPNGLAAPRAAQLLIHRLKLALLQLLGTHGGAAQCKAGVITGGGSVELGRGELINGSTGGSRCAGNQICHGLGVAGAAPINNCNFAHDKGLLFR